MFVTDTIDAVYPPDDWTPHAIVDRLSIVMSDRLTSISAKDGNQLEDVAISIDPQIHPTRMDTHLAHRRRPLLAQVRQKTKLKSLVALEPFFGRISLYSFESAYRLGSVDWHSVSSSIESDIFEG